MANRAPRTQKTWSLLGDVRRKPSTYEVAAAREQHHAYLERCGLGAV